MDLPTKLHSRVEERKKKKVKSGQNLVVEAADERAPKLWAIRSTGAPIHTRPRGRSYF